MAATTFIPELPEQLTAQWLTDVLPGAALDGAQVVSVSQSRLGEGEGFVGDILKLSLEFDRDDVPCPASVVAKMPKLANRAMGELLGAYERENMFYMSFGDNLPVATPKMYYGEFDRDAGSERQEELLRKADEMPVFLHGLLTRLARWIAARKQRRYILVIEDISDATPCDQLAGLDRTGCAAIVRATARLHAHFWEHSSLADHFWLLPMDIDARLRHQMMLRSRPAFAELFPQALQDGLAPYVDDVAVNGVDYCRQLSAGPTTLAHGDLRLDNLFFRDDEVVFIDWQLVRRGAPAYDLAYVLSSALNDSDSADALLQEYHTELLAAGVEGYPLANLLQDYQTGLRVVLLNLSTVDQVDLGSGRGVELLRVWINRLRKRLQVDCPLV